ncbi:hypothetical protein OD91_0172 [Lutibacter sp. Hel_I_33_5]|nr:hypothetical protein OD91_0172 [Lutibacter sp. Hel_I_33_5]
MLSLILNKITKYSIAISLILFFSLHINSQENELNGFSKKELNRLKSFDTIFNDYKFNNNFVNLNLENVLFYDKKRRQNKTWACIFTGASAILLIQGIAFDTRDNGISDLFSDVSYLGSAIYLGASIPFHIGIRKNKKLKEKKLLFVVDELKNNQD